MPTILDCPSCGRKLRVAEAPPGAGFQCPSCGNSFAPPTVTAAPPELPTVRCPYCREDILPGAIQCRHCGEDLRSDRPPWERTGAVRRDAEPHRGSLVLLLGIVGLIASLLGPLAIVGAPLSITAWVMGQRDLRRMREGVMDPQGRDQTMPGMICGIIGTAYGGFILIIYGFILMALLTTLV